MSDVEGELLSAYAASDWPRAVGLVETHWTSLLFAPSTTDVVFATVREAPEDELVRCPRAGLIAEAIGRLPVRSVPVTLPGGAARVDEVLRRGTARSLVEIATLAMISRRVAGLLTEATALAEASRPLVRAAATTRFSPAADLAAYWHLQAGQAALHAGDLDQARLDLRHAWTFSPDDVTGYVAASAAPFLALLAALAGDDAEGARWQQEVDRLAEHGVELYEWDTMERPRLVARLLHAADRLDLEEGARLTEALLPQLSFDEIWPVTVYAVVRHLVNAGEPSRAEQVLDAAVALHAPSVPGSMHATYTALARADLALAHGRPDVRLTPSEARVLTALAEDGSLPEVAERLFISRNTLKTHVRALYAKLDVSSRDEAVALGHRLGLLGTSKARHPDG